MKKTLLTLAVIASCFSVQCIRPMNRMIRKEEISKSSIIANAMEALDDYYFDTEKVERNKYLFQFPKDSKSILKILMTFDSSDQDDFEKIEIHYLYVGELPRGGQAPSILPGEMTFEKKST